MTRRFWLTATFTFDEEENYEEGVAVFWMGMILFTVFLSTVTVETDTKHPV